jgi:hypothetical protein
MRHRHPHQAGLLCDAVLSGAIFAMTHRATDLLALLLRWQRGG